MYLFFVNRLAGGGAERNLVRIAECMAESGRTVHLAVLQEDPSEDILPGSSLTLHRLHLNRNRNLISRLLSHPLNLYKIRGLVGRLRPACILTFCFRTNLLILEAAAGSGIPVVVSERSNPHLHLETYSERLRRRFWYPRAARVVLLAEELEPWAKSFRPEWAVSSIPNFILVPPWTPPPKERERKRLLAMGRFIHAKGFDLLLKIFSELVMNFPDWDLTIVGDGPLRNELDELAIKLGIKRHVEFPGWSTDPYYWYCNSDLFAFPSRFEGFGMTLAEALSCGLPAVAFDCPHGPSRILANQTNGFLVEPGSVAEFRDRLSVLMGDPELRRKMGESGRLVLDKYGVDSIMPQWERVLKEVTELPRAKVQIHQSGSR